MCARMSCLLAWLLLAAGCSTVVEQVSLSKNPTYFVVGSNPGDYRDIFSVSDEKVTLRVVFAPNLVGGWRTFRVDWIAPDGSVFLSEPVKTRWGSNETLFASLHIADNQPARMPGKWSVRLFHEEEELISRSFVIER